MNTCTLSILISVVVFVLTEGNMESSSKDCPLWTTLQNGSCKCGNINSVHCEENRGAYAVADCYCLTLDETKTFPVVGECSYTCRFLATNSSYDLYGNETQDLDKLCRHYNRTGVMCGECVEGYGLPVYSYSLACVECSHYKYNWLKYIAVALITLYHFTVHFACTLDCLLSMCSCWIMLWLSIH